MSENQFRSTPNGRFYAKDMESLYAITIISLNLNEKGSSSGWFGTAYPYSFSVAHATKTMVHMTLSVRNGTISTVNCGIQKDKVKFFLGLFLAAHLLHCPGDRTRSEVQDNVLLQPTAKGLHFVQRYGQRIGYKYKTIERLLLSSFNSMRVLLFERQVYSDQIVRSKMFIFLLFQRVMGQFPNCYSANGISDPIPKNTVHSLYGDTADYSLYSPVSAEFSPDVLDLPPACSPVEYSPYHHRFYTHPDSTATLQYYVNSTGVRLFQDRSFKLGHHGRRQRPSAVLLLPGAVQHNNLITLSYSFTGKALWQWVMDCTDVMLPGEAVDLVSYFLEYELIEPIVLEPSISTMSSLVVSSDAFYVISAKGLKICQWDQAVKDELLNTKTRRSTPAVGSPLSADSDTPDIEPSSSSRSASRIDASRRDLTLDQLLRDAGLRLLFREHLEKNMCQENLMFYNDMENMIFNEKMLKKCILTGHFKAEFYTEKLLNLAYSIYNRYLVSKASHELNVAPAWRNRLEGVLFGDENERDGKSKPKDSAISNRKKKDQDVVSEAMVLLVKLNHYVFSMMEKDSLPKFLQTNEFQNAIKLYHEDIYITGSSYGEVKK